MITTKTLGSVDPELQRFPHRQVASRAEDQKLLQMQVDEVIPRVVVARHQSGGEPVDDYWLVLFIFPSN